MSTPKPATLQFGIGYGFIVTASTDGTIPLNSKALAKIEPGGDDAITEMQRRANAYPRLVEALRSVTNGNVDCGTYWQVDADDIAGIRALLRELGEGA